jgi:hypothetical protein
MEKGRITTKDILKNMLDDMGSFIGKRLVLENALSGIAGPLGLFSMPFLSLGKSVISGIRGSIASFDDGGIPQGTGLGILHKSDVVVNPGSDNTMMEMLSDKLAEKITNRTSRISVNLDGRKMAEVAVSHINNMNRTLPRGRDVFDEGRWS